MYQELKIIEAELEGNEYFANGVSYLFAVDELSKNQPIQESLTKILSEWWTEEIKTESLKLEQIDDYREDISLICNEWHLTEQKNCILEAIGKDVKVYRFCEDYVYPSAGNVSSVYRLLVNSNERIIIEFYLTD